MSSTNGSSMKAKAANAHCASLPSAPKRWSAAAALLASCGAPLPSSWAATTASTAATKRQCMLTTSCEAMKAVEGISSAHRAFQASYERLLSPLSTEASTDTCFISWHLARRSRKAATTSSAHSELCRSASGTSGASNRARRLPLLLVLCLRRLSCFSSISTSTVSGTCIRSHCTRRRYSSASLGGSSLGGSGPPLTGKHTGCASSSSAASVSLLSSAAAYAQLPPNSWPITCASSSSSASTSSKLLLYWLRPQRPPRPPPRPESPICPVNNNECA
mmetsp:Transcript_43019/g.77172  ORF Transcript_43019/g.77172 Transcript_43019/m.77172 type:complete len:276 (-) Transcript_43019:8-835(-)